MPRKRKRQTSPLHDDGQESMQYAATPVSNIPVSSHTDRNLVDFLLDNHDIRRLVLDRITVHDFAMLAATNKRLRASLFEERFDVNHILKRFLKDPIAFRQILRQCNAFVGGMFPLSIFEGRHWRGIPLDIYVESDSFNRLLKFITARERYHIMSEKGNADLQICSLERRWTGGRTEVIRLLQPKVRPPESLLPEIPLLHVFVQTSHLTPEWCLMTWDRLISFFPRVTFLEHKMYALSGLTDDLGTALDYFASNHWPLEDLVSDPSDVCHMSGYPSFIHTSLNSIRRVGDCHAYHIRLNADDIDHETSHVPPTVLDYCEFDIRQLDDMKLDLGFRFNQIDHPLLRWRYTSALYGGWPIWEGILHRLDKMLPFEVLRLPVDQRPRGFLSEPNNGGVRSVDVAFLGFHSTYNWSDFKKPTSWKYQDHMVPGWYDFYLKREAEREAAIKAADRARRELEADSSD